MTIKERNELIVNYIPLAQSLAWKAKQNISLPLDELQSAAYFGLIDAAIKYVSEKSSFGTYARFRISGELKDFVRKSYKENARMILNDCMDVPARGNKSFDFDYFLDGLNDIEQKILKMYYVEDISMKAIGKEFNLSESRVSQILKQLRNHIKNRMSCRE